jgi:hypothetical protein
MGVQSLQSFIPFPTSIFQYITVLTPISMSPAPLFIRAKPFYTASRLHNKFKILKSRAFVFLSSLNQEFDFLNSNFFFKIIRVTVTVYVTCNQTFLVYTTNIHRKWHPINYKFSRPK